MIGADLAGYIKHVLYQPYPDEFIREILHGLTPLGATFVALVLVDQVCPSEVDHHELLADGAHGGKLVDDYRLQC